MRRLATLGAFVLAASALIAAQAPDARRALPPPRLAKPCHPRRIPKPS